MMLKTPVGVGRPGTPVDTGPCATRTPLLKSVTFWLPIETTICSGPFGIWPKPISFFLGSAFSFFVAVGATRALWAGIAAGGAYQPSYQPYGAPMPRASAELDHAAARHATPEISAMRNASSRPDASGAVG